MVGAARRALLLALCAGWGAAPAAPRPSHHGLGDLRRTALAGASLSGRPHLLMVLVDDLGWSDVGFGAQPGAFRTPNLDRYAGAGVRLDAHYVHPLCTPSRAALLTGRYCHHHGLCTFLRNADERGLRADTPTLAERLRDAGYRTALVGKWHLGHAAPAQTPTFRGFERFFGFYNGWHAYTGGGRPYVNASGPACGPTCAADADADGAYHTELFGEEAARIVRQAAPNATAAPLFLVLAFGALHSAVESPHDARRAAHPGGADGAARLQAADPTRAAYGGALAQVDLAFGALMRALHDTGLARDAVVLVTSDNGGRPPSAGGSADYNGARNWPLRGGKADAFEGGVRARAFVWAGERAWRRGGARGGPAAPACAALLHAVDWAPTFLRLARAPLLPAQTDGAPLWAALATATPSAALRARERQGLLLDAQLAPAAPAKQLARHPARRPARPRGAEAARAAALAVSVRVAVRTRRWKLLLATHAPSLSAPRVPSAPAGAGVVLAPQPAAPGAPPRAPAERRVRMALNLSAADARVARAPAPRAANGSAAAAAAAHLAPPPTCRELGGARVVALLQEALGAALGARAADAPVALFELQPPQPAGGAADGGGGGGGAGAARAEAAADPEANDWALARPAVGAAMCEVLAQQLRARTRLDELQRASPLDTFQPAGCEHRPCAGRRGGASPVRPWAALPAYGVRPWRDAPAFEWPARPAAAGRRGR